MLSRSRAGQQMYTIRQCGEQPTAMTIPMAEFFCCFFFPFPCSDVKGLHFSSDRHSAPAEQTTSYGSPECIPVVVILMISTI